MASDVVLVKVAERRSHRLKAPVVAIWIIWQGWAVLDGNGMSAGVRGATVRRRLRDKAVQVFRAVLM